MGKLLDKEIKNVKVIDIESFSELNVQILEDISIYSKEECVDVILKNNETIFYKIEYCEEKETLIFYSEDKLDFSEWENRGYNKKIFMLDDKGYNDIYRLLVEEQICPKDCVPFSVLVTQMRNIYKEMIVIEKKYDKKIVNAKQNNMKRFEINHSKTTNDFCGHIATSIIFEGIDKFECRVYLKENCIKFFKEKPLDLNIAPFEKILVNYLNEINLYKKAIFNMDVQRGINAPLYYNTMDPDYSQIVKSFVTFENKINLIFGYPIGSSIWDNNARIYWHSFAPKRVISYSLENSTAYDSNIFRDLDKVSNLVAENYAELSKRIFFKIDDCPEILKKRLYEHTKHNSYIENSLITEDNQNEVVRDFSYEQELLAKKVIDDIVTRKIVNLFNYYKLDIKYNGLDSDLESKLNTDAEMIRELASIKDIQSLSLIKIKDVFDNRDCGIIYIEINSEEKLFKCNSRENNFNHYIDWIYDNIDKVCNTKFVTAGFEHNIFNNYVFPNNREDNFNMNKKHLLAIREELVNAFPFEYDPKVVYEEKVRVRKDNRS